MRMFIALFLALLPAHALAECDNPEELLRLAYPEAIQSSDGYFLSGDYAQRISPEDVACKVWPYKPELTLMAVPLLEADPRRLRPQDPATQSSRPEGTGAVRRRLHLHRSTGSMACGCA